jgi:anaerobic magnesium-protoporphyrin IX monomethyl ester cyclase
MRKKIILVNPPLSGKDRYGNLARAGAYMPPLGLGFLASVLRNRGFDVRLLDCEALGLDVRQAVKNIFSFEPDYVGITAVTISIHSAAELAAELKKTDKTPRVILGGTHVSAVPEETMRLFPQFDIGVIGEGEVTIVRLLEDTDNNRPLSGINGIVYRDNGKVIKNQGMPLIDNLDSLPFPAWDMYPELKKYYRPSTFGFQKLPSTSLITSRGCLGKCSFCSDVVWQRRYREHSVGYVMDMIKELYYKYGIRDIAIYDGVFGVNRARLLKLCEALIRENLDLAWSCNFRIEMAETEILRAMKKAGCWSIAYGIESCSREILEFLQKNIDLDMIRRTLKMTKEAGILSKGYIMIGSPLETAATIKKTLDVILELDLDILTVNSFTPFPGTLDYERADKYGSFKRDWKLLNQHNLVFIPYGLTQEQISYYIRLITRKFYLRLKILWKYFKMSLNPFYFKSLFLGFCAFIKFTIRDIRG